MSNSHYFDDDPSVKSAVHRIPLQLADVSLELDVDRGVFSSTKIDAGTRVLLVEAARPAKTAKILDIGCGYGPIACAVATRAPKARVWAIDVNARARGLCAANAERLGLNITVHAPEEVPAEQRFDLIVSNPPIRIGKKNLHALLELWLDRLAPGGRAELVVQKHLGSDSLQRWLNEQGWPTVRLTSRSGYRVLVARPRPQRLIDAKADLAATQTESVADAPADKPDQPGLDGGLADGEVASNPPNGESSQPGAEPQ